jgi:hypothetical protein
MQSKSQELKAPRTTLSLTKVKTSQPTDIRLKEQGDHCWSSSPIQTIQTIQTIQKIQTMKKIQTSTQH